MTDTVPGRRYQCRVSGFRPRVHWNVNNTGGKGDLDTDAQQRAVLQYRNTPDPDTKISPAMCVFGRMIRDFIPVIPGKCLPHDTWRARHLARHTTCPRRCTPQKAYKDARVLERTHQAHAGTDSGCLCPHPEPNWTTPEQMGPHRHGRGSQTA